MHDGSPSAQLDAASSQQQQQQQHLAAMDSYLESHHDLGVGPSAYALHDSHDGALAGEMGDIQGFVLGLGQDHAHELQQAAAGSSGVGAGGDHAPDDQQQQQADDGQSVIDPAFQQELSAADGQPSAKQPQQQQQQQPPSAATASEPVYATAVGQVDALASLLEADRDAFKRRYSAGEADVEAAGFLGSLDGLRSYLAAHHQHH